MFPDFEFCRRLQSEYYRGRNLFDKIMEILRGFVAPQQKCVTITLYACGAAIIRSGWYIQ